jgi:hypothetical protein
MEEVHSDEAVAGRQTLAGHGKTQFAHICLYNSLYNSGETKDGIEALATMHANLLSLHGFMAGFQFIALEGEINLEGDAIENAIELAVFTTRYLGFSLSLAGALICLIVQSYLIGMKDEKIKTQVDGICKYAMFFQFGDYTAIASIVCLGISANVLLWKSEFPFWLAIILNTFFSVGGLLLLFAFLAIIFKKQDGRQLYADKTFIQAEENRNSFFDKIKE